MNQRQYILRLLDRTGWSQTELAKRAGLDPSTLSRFLSNTHESHELRASTIKRLELVSGIAYSENDGVLSARQSGFSEIEAIPYAGHGDGNTRAALAALGAGTDAIDGWVLRSRALELVGFRPGDIVLVNLSMSPLRGDIVCAQILDWTTGSAQTVFRLYSPPILAAATTEMSLSAPLSLDNNKIFVKGVVVSMLRVRQATDAGFSEDSPL